MSCRHQSHHLAARAGLSVIEVLFALVLVSVGILGMAGTSTLAVRSAAAAGREHRAVRIATARLVSLNAAGCNGAGSGVTLENAIGVKERWVVQPAHNGGAQVEVRVEWREGTHARSLMLESALLC